MSDTPDREGRPPVRRARTFVSGSRREDLLPLALGQTAPDSVRLMDLQGVPTALEQRRAPRTDRLRLRLAPGPRRSSFTFGVEEVRAGHAATRGVQLPVPHVGVGPRKAPGVSHHVPLCDLGRPDARTTDEGGGRATHIRLRRRPSLLPPDPLRCRGCSCLDHRTRDDHDQDPARPVAGGRSRGRPRLRGLGDRREE